MSLLDKIKNVLFTEEDDETSNIPVVKNEESHYEKVVERNEKITYKDAEPTERHRMKRDEDRPEIQMPKIEKEEKSPFQQFDEEEFDRIAAINKNRLLERDRKAREEKERKEKELHLKEQERQKEREKKLNYEREKAISKMPKVHPTPTHIEVQDAKKFKPSPVISPVYGILDKNYTKEDILPRASSDGTLPKIMDVDKVRQKAFGTLEELEKQASLEDLPEVNIKITSFEDQVEDDTSVVLDKKDLDEIADRIDDSKLTEAEEKRIKELLKEDDKKENIIEPSVEDEIDEPTFEEELTKEIVDTEEEKDVEEQEINASDDTLENDLFNLIDSMYQDKEEE